MLDQLLWGVHEGRTGEDAAQLLRMGHVGLNKRWEHPITPSRLDEHTSNAFPPQLGFDAIHLNHHHRSHITRCCPCDGNLAWSLTSTS